MARTIAEIKESMTSAFIAVPIIRSLFNLKDNNTFEDQFAPVSPLSVIFYIVSAAIWTLETLFDLHNTEVNEIIADKNPGSTRWYAWISRQFQFGFNLLPDSGQFDNTGHTDEEIQASKIIAYSACVELLQPNGKILLLIKVAKEDTDLKALTSEEKTAFTEYIERIRYAGTNTNIISEPGDSLKLDIEILYNPLVLNAQGQRLDGSGLTPVKDAISSFLKNLPFNGIFVNAFLVDALQQVPGVVVPNLRSASYKYGNLENWLPIDVKYQPYSGWLRIADSDMNIVYTPQSEIL